MTQGKPKPRKSIEDAKRWADMYQRRMSIVKIAKEEGVDPGTVSTWLHKLGLKVKSGQHFVPQPSLKLPDSLISIVSQGQDTVVQFLEEHVWGLQMSKDGLAQLNKFCRFIELYKAQQGVEEIAHNIGVHRSTVAEWRNGTDLPYLIRTLNDTLGIVVNQAWKTLPLRIESGGNEPRNWITVPTRIDGYEEIARTVGQLQTSQDAFTLASRFGIDHTRLDSMKEELFAYVLGVMMGDASKLGGERERFISANLDLQLSVKHESNERMGEFVCLALNALGIEMHRIVNKKPSGTTRYGRHPSEAYRWTSARSPLLAWMFNVCLGLSFEQTTSSDPVSMDWMFGMPRSFKTRFIQGVADSDGTVKPYEILIASVPNADFITDLLRDLGLTTAHTVFENGVPLRTMVNKRQASELPIFNEIVRSYRYVNSESYGKRDFTKASDDGK